MERRKIYLACPYSHPDPTIREYRFRVVNRVAGRLMKQGHLVFSPISHTHPICVAQDLPYNYDFWKDYDETFMDWAEEFMIVIMEGHLESDGINRERKYMNEQGKPVSYIEPTLEELEIRTPISRR